MPPPFSLLGYVLTLELVLLMLASFLAALALRDRTAHRPVHSRTRSDRGGALHECVG